MNILIAPDSFKDCLKAPEVARALARGIQNVMPGANIRMHPMADGGEGTVESVIDATGGQIIHVRVRDPLMREIQSFYGITGDGKTAVIEMAAASGLELLAADERNPWITSTFGTGQLMLDALNRGCRTFLLGIGGSATNDGGTGMAKAMGIRFHDAGGREVKEGGGAIGDIAFIHMEGLDPRIRACRIRVACDVDNPLTGPEGASMVYAPQKGAGPEMVRKLDANLVHLAGLVHRELGVQIDGIPGAGAAGGLGAGLLAFLRGELGKGFEMVSEVTGLEAAIRKADLVITGEGRMDAQTRFGKTPFGIAQMACRHGRRLIGVAGTLEENAGELYRHGFSLLMPIMEGPMTLGDAIKNAPLLLEKTGERIGRMLLMVT
jgi:glycerate kinase